MAAALAGTPARFSLYHISQHFVNSFFAQIFVFYFSQNCAEC
jgi:hypothetical protein